MLVPNTLKAKPSENYDDLKKQFFALKTLCESKIKQCSNYSKKLAEYDRESLIARNEALESEKEMNAQLTEELAKANERIEELERYNAGLANKLHNKSLAIDKANERVRELEKELTLSTDQNDLLLDEFIRVKHLTDNTEIHGLCERAHVRMRQNVSVIDRNHQLERKVAELKNKVNSLENSDGGLLLKALFYAPSSPVSAAKAEEIESWYEKVKQLRREQE